MTEKERREICDFNLFLRHSNLDISVNSDSIKPGEDPPDICFVTSIGTSIGVELTRLIIENGDKIVQIHKKYDKVLEIAKNLYESENLPSIYLSVDFFGRINTTKGNDKIIAKEIYQHIKKQNIGENSYLSLDEDLPQHVEKIQISLNLDGEKNSWVRNKDFFYGEVKSKQLHRQINDKNKKLIAVKDNLAYDENWLLLIEEGGVGSIFTNFKPTDFDLNPEWAFDRIYVFGKFMMREAVRLK